MYFLYNLVLILFFVLTSPFFLFKIFISARYRKGITERFGFLSRQIKENLFKDNRYILIRAASVGEVKASKLLVEQLRENFLGYKIVFSTVTPEGYKIAGDLKLGDVRIFSPLDFPFCVKEVLRLFKPDLLILVETEIWPNLIKEAKKSGSKIILVNGRISEESFNNYKFIQSLLKNVFGYIDIFSMREEQDKRRIIALGANPDKVVVSGNIKYDQLVDIGTKSTDKATIYKEFGLRDNDLIFVAGSTKKGEEEIILGAYQKVLEKFSKLRLIIAPRHLARVKEIEKIFSKYSVRYVKKTDIEEDSSYITDSDVILLDTIGDLIKAYSIATITFVGGSLVPKGGQNIMEPASLGKPVLFGPSMESFFETAELFKRTGGAQEVEDARELTDKILYFLSNPEIRLAKGEKLHKAVLSMQGATQRNVDLIKKVIN